MKHAISPIMIAVIFALAFCVPSARAALITIEITAEVDSVRDEDNYLEGRINPGDIITGTYTYESTTPDSNPSSTVEGHYWHYAPPAGVSLTAGGFNFTTDPSNVEFLVLIANNSSSGADIYTFCSYNNLPLSNGVSIDYIYWELKDATTTALSSKALPTTPPILDNWQSNRLSLLPDPREYRSFGIEAHVTSAIPEPGTILLFALGALFLRKLN